ncbi:hypothetical protein GCM10011320_45990 [Neoroseomonas lacus]|uniref:Transposase IS4-like domain-containing protein n=1 Tax=Neoroseomonas lacus TaxID=287609 RepID=A0A917KZX0_9PROT|nr:hypothetical protein GCM10011320_45990 [Neoroseomonas lacus]
MREVLNAIFYVPCGGIPWRMRPGCFPPRQTVYGWFSRFRDRGVWESVNHHLVMLDRERVGRETSPFAAVIDSQSTKTTKAGGPRDYDAGKNVQGRKRYAMVDIDGRPLVLRCHAASVQDSDGAIPLLQASRGNFPFVEKAFADAGYAARRVADASCIAIEIVRKPKDQIGFAVHRGAGWSNAASPGSAVTAASSRISNRPSLPRRHSYTPPPCNCSPDDWLVPPEFRVRLLHSMSV